MREIAIHLETKPGGEVRVTADLDGVPAEDPPGRPWERTIPLEVRQALLRDAGTFDSGFGAGRRPLMDPVDLLDLGGRLRKAVFGPVIDGWSGESPDDGCRIVFRSSDAGLLNLPWELLPAQGGRFLVEDGRWSMRRTVRPRFAVNGAPAIPRPLRILFCACAPISLGQLDYDREEDAILKATARLGDRVHPDFAESGTYDELRELASVAEGIEVKPAHLKGLGRLTGVGDVFLDEGTVVAKVGRTTGLTRGRVTAFELDNIRVAFGIGELRFDNQIEIEGAEEGSFSEGGDSGSLIVGSDLRAVALLFAGSDQGGANGQGLTYANPIHAVLQALKVELALA
ncbi:MAG: hypothetical protein KF833_16560 [Verrucomicrobiae bacterium]|nr:hypothetical protein [Verrucomicrobiae bacterium]